MFGCYKCCDLKLRDADAAVNDIENLMKSAGEPHVLHMELREVQFRHERLRAAVSTARANALRAELSFQRAATRLKGRLVQPPVAAAADAPVVGSSKTLKLSVAAPKSSEPPPVPAQPATSSVLPATSTAVDAVMSSKSCKPSGAPVVVPVQDTEQKQATVSSTSDKIKKATKSTKSMSDNKKSSSSSKASSASSSSKKHSDEKQKKNYEKNQPDSFSFQLFFGGTKSLKERDKQKSKEQTRKEDGKNQVSFSRDPRINRRDENAYKTMITQESTVQDKDKSTKNYEKNSEVCLGKTKTVKDDTGGQKKDKKKHKSKHSKSHRNEQDKAKPTQPQPTNAAVTSCADQNVAKHDCEKAKKKNHEKKSETHLGTTKSGKDDRQTKKDQEEHVKSKAIERPTNVHTVTSSANETQIPLYPDTTKSSKKGSSRICDIIPRISLELASISSIKEAQQMCQDLMRESSVRRRLSMEDELLDDKEDLARIKLESEAISNSNDNEFNANVPNDEVKKEVNTLFRDIMEQKQSQYRSSLSWQNSKYDEQSFADRDTKVLFFLD